MSASERAGLAALVAAFAAAYSSVSLFRHWHFDSSAFDLGIFDQAIWHMSRFEAPASTIAGHSNLLGDHFHPILALLAPLYWIAPAAETLLVAQAILLASSIVPVYVFLRRRMSGGPALVLCAAHGSFWGMQRTAAFDVHEAAFAPLLVAVAILAIDQRRWRLLWLASAALMLVKEDMIPLVAGFGVYLMWMGERRRGAALLILSVAVLAAVLLLIIPWFSDAGRWSYWGAFEGAARRPWTIVLQLVTPAGKLTTVLLWLAPFLFLPLFSPIGALLVPIVLERLLSASPNHWAPNFHYSAPLAPILVMAAGDTLARIGARVRDGGARTRLLAILATAILVVSFLLPGHQPLLRVFTAKHYRPMATAEAGYAAVSHIPPAASVVAQGAVAPHLSQRSQIYLLDAGAPDADFVIASLDLDPWPAGSRSQISQWLDERRRRGYATVFETDGWVVLAR